LGVILAFFAAVFLGILAALSFEIFAPVFVCFRVLRPEGGFAAAVFFGFFMATILAQGRVGCWRLSPAFRTRNVNLIFALRREFHAIETSLRMQLVCKTIELPERTLFTTTCLPSGQSELNSDGCRASG
jgi:hypothetical protein